MSCGVGRRRSSDPVLLLLWLWCRLAATAPIRPPSLEPPYARGAALGKAKKKRKKLQGWTLTFLITQPKSSTAPKFDS